MEEEEEFNEEAFENFLGALGDLKDLMEDKKNGKVTSD